ncbi:hypothetical protein U0D62_21795 [Aquimarina sp. 2201CG5-10]|nr:hypothetical protein [Aquimarina sp. 2201CG5-10]
MNKIFTFNLVITMALVIYILISVVKLILPSVDSSMLYLIISTSSFLLFIGCCYYVYLNSKTLISYSLMVAASCFLIVNITSALNHLYVSLEIFLVIIRLLQISGQFFLVKFFIEQNDLIPNGEDYF